jgi:sialic acid synthase SpsE
MPKVILRNNKILENYGEPYFVAEFNTSHNGSIDTAKEMIRKAKEVGCDCVKFQSWSTESLYSQSYYDNNPIAKRFVKKFALNEPELYDLAMYCKEVGISFASTPYSKQEVDFLIDQCDVPYIKVASMDLVTYPFLEYIAQKKVPIFLATGMSDINEVKKAVSVIEKAGNHNICLLHCISIYPAEISTINLNNIIGLSEIFPKYPIGFSDHSLGSEMPIASIALGTAMIEKHFTLDKTKIGMDNQMAMEPEEMYTLVWAKRIERFLMQNWNNVRR